MKISRTLWIVIFIVFILALMQSVCFASKADELLAKARRAVSTAQAAESSLSRDESYKEAVKLYNEVYNQFKDSPQGARALLELASLYETAKGKTNNLYLSHETLKKMLAYYHKNDDALKRNLESSEYSELKRIVNSAETKKIEIEKKLDEKNSSGTLYKILDFFVNITGKKPAFSYWFAVVLVTIIVKILITPLTKAQFKAMKEMQRVAPLIKQIQEEYKGDQKAIGEKTLEVYKEHKINPFASCLPILVQMPILILLYKMIRSYEFQFLNGKFLWIGSGLSHVKSIFVPIANTEVYFTAANLAEPDLLLVVMYLVSMYISTRLSAVDPTQADQQKMMAILMPVMFAFIFAGFPSAFILYWLIFNILQTTQQYLILQAGKKEAVVVGAVDTELPANSKVDDEPEDDVKNKNKK
ncbi:MAG: YidC/Oxa1 family membrane protein insertase [Armatimonadota bacterium]